MLFASVPAERGIKSNAQQANQTLYSRSRWKDVPWDLRHIGPSKHARLFATF